MPVKFAGMAGVVVLNNLGSRAVDYFVEPRWQYWKDERQIGKDEAQIRKYILQVSHADFVGRSMFPATGRELESLQIDLTLSM